MEEQEKFRFFIVDDDIFYGTIYEQYLKNLGYSDMTYFSNGKDCLDNLNQNPDIVFLDHDMDGITGFEVLKKIKTYNPNIYVIMISGQNNINTIVNAIKYGAFDFLIKDQIVCEKLTAIINKIIKIKKELKKKRPNLSQ